MGDEKEGNTSTEDKNPLPPLPKEHETRQSGEPQKDGQNPANIQQPSKPVWWRDKDRRDIALILVTGFLAAFTAWMAWETHKLSGDSAQQAKATAISAKATEKAATATERSVAVAESSLAITKQSLAIAETSIAVTKRNARITEKITKMDLRAYIVLEDFEMSEIRVGAVPRVTGTMKNIGKTPAYRVTIVSTLKLGTGVYPHEMKAVDVATADTGFFLGSGAGRQIFDRFHRIWTKEDSVVLESGKMTFHFICHIAFRDKFNEPQFVQSCYVYRHAQKDMVNLRKCEAAS